MLKKVLLLVLFICLLTGQAEAQVTKDHNKPLIWTELEADYFLKNQSFFYFRNQYRSNTDKDFSGIKESGALSNFYEIYVLLGYDYKFTDHWRGGISARYTFTTGNDNRIWLAMLQHNGKIGSVDFIKRLAYDVTQYDEGDSRGRLRPRMALEKSFNFKQHTLRPHISYELFIHNNFQPDDQVEPETRTVDRTRWRMGVSFKATPHIWLTPYFIKQTDYHTTIETYSEQIDVNGNKVLDADGKPILILNPGGKLNIISPIFGLDLRIMLPGRHLSDKAVPNLGSGGSSED